MKKDLLKSILLLIVVILIAGCGKEKEKEAEMEDGFKLGSYSIVCEDEIGEETVSFELAAGGIVARYNRVHSASGGAGTDYYTGTFNVVHDKLLISLTKEHLEGWGVEYDGVNNINPPIVYSYSFNSENKLIVENNCTVTYP